MNKKLLVISTLASIIILLANCSKNNNGTPNLSVFKALPLSIPSPIDNLQSPAKISLGKLLFWDPILSGNKDVACATCHNAASGFTDNLDLSIGVNGVGTGNSRHFLANSIATFTKRNCQTIINTAFNGLAANDSCDPTVAAMFYDVRTRSLELQSLDPVKTLEEMRGNKITATAILDSVIKRLSTIPEYAQLFSTAFQNNNAINITNLGKAIACYERSIVANNSPYDKYIRGDQSALSGSQIDGMNAFQNSGCINCHKGAMFSDYELHVLSVPDNPKQGADAGANNTYQFRTSSLRNLAFTAPYMHSGIFSNLDEVLNFYDQVGNHRSQNAQVNASQLDGNLQHIDERDKNNLIQFLNALNDNTFDKSIPSTVPSGLHPGGNL